MSTARDQSRVIDALTPRLGSAVRDTVRLPTFSQSVLRAQFTGTPHLGAAVRDAVPLPTLTQRMLRPEFTGTPRLSAAVRDAVPLRTPSQRALLAGQPASALPLIVAGRAITSPARVQGRFSDSVRRQSYAVDQYLESMAPTTSVGKCDLARVRDQFCGHLSPGALQVVVREEFRLLSDRRIRELQRKVSGAAATRPRGAAVLARSLQVEALPRELAGVLPDASFTGGAERWTVSAESPDDSAAFVETELGVIVPDGSTVTRRAERSGRLEVVEDDPAARAAWVLDAADVRPAALGDLLRAFDLRRVIRLRESKVAAILLSGFMFVVVYLVERTADNALDRTSIPVIGGKKETSPPSVTINNYYFGHGAPTACGAPPARAKQRLDRRSAHEAACRADRPEAESATR